jgi:DNA-binding NarL/FixJ family response regulator
MVVIDIVEDDTTAAGLLRQYLDHESIAIRYIHGSAEEALERLSRDGSPQSILVDIKLPGLDGIELIRRVSTSWPSIDIIVQTVSEDTRTILDAIKAGAHAYVLKASSKRDIVHCIEEVRNGGSFLSGKIARSVLAEFASTGKDQAGPHDGKEQEGTSTLSRREREMLESLAAGAAYKEIAAMYGLSYHTVNNHMRNIYRKLRVHSRGEAVARYYSRAPEGT